MVLRDIVASVHQVVGHAGEEVQRCADRRGGALGEGKHVSRKTWDGS